MFYSSSCIEKEQILGHSEDVHFDLIKWTYIIAGHNRY
jgi:hypothetical protein